MEYLHCPGAQPLRGYRLIEPLGKGGFGEVWKCAAPGGRHKAIKLVPRDGNPLVRTPGEAGAEVPGAISPLYTAPEVFQGRVSPASDQYSLAVAYLELLTGALPFRGKNARRLAMQHCTEEPDLGGLPEADRPHVA